jgi:hypothetical protein
MAQALHLINGAGVNQKIAADSGLVAGLIKAGKKDSEIVEELYLTCFGRLPMKLEMEASLQTIDEAINPKPPVPADVKPVDPKAVKPVAPKPVEVKAAVDAKPAADAKPADAKAPEMKPAPKPAEAPKVDPVLARRQVLEDLLWALINGKEFVFNH